MTSINNIIILLFFFATYTHFNAQVYTTAQDGNFNNSSTWVAGNIPPAASQTTEIIINHDITLDVNRNLLSIDVSASGSLTDSGSFTLFIYEGGSITNNGIFNLSSSRVQFEASATVNGTNSRYFHNVDLFNLGTSQGVDFGSQSHILNELRINLTAFVDTGSPIYGPNSTLIYQSNNDATNPYERRSEWSNFGLTQNPQTNQGTPHHVVLRNTHLDMGADNNTDPAIMTGDLIIEDDGFLYLDYDNNDMTAPLEVGGNFINEGVISLSDLPGGDLVVEGDFTDSGTINYNNRAIFFEGPNDQQLIGDASGGAYFMDVVRVDKPSGEVFLNQDTEINKTLDPLTLSNEGILNINGFNLILGEPGMASQITFNGNSALKGSDTSSLTLKGGGSMGDIVFDDTDDGTSNALGNIYLERDTGATVELDNTVYLKQGISLTSGTLNSNGNLVFVSDENNTAIVREVPNPGGSISDDVVIQRHFPLSGLQRSFRYISPSAETSTSIHANWQEGATTGNFNPEPNFGTHITGSQGVINTVDPDTGFDRTETGNYSLYTWNEISQQWDPVTSTIDDASTVGTVENTLEIGDAFALMVRGDRSATLLSNTDEGSNPATIRTRGSIRKGNFSYNFNSPFTIGDLDKFVLVGNPYQSQVDISEVFSNEGTSGINQGYVWVWDPTITDKGAYAVVDLNDGSNDVALPLTSDANEFLQPFQAVFTQVNSAGPQIINFEENDKDNSELQTGVFSEDNFNITSKLEIELYDSQNSLLLDAARLQFDSAYSNAKTFEDAVKFWNYDEYLAIINSNAYLSIDKRKLPQSNDTIPLYLGNYQTSQYTLKLASTLDDNTQAQLYDHYLQQAIDIDNGNNTYNFTIDQNIPETYDSGRFELIFNPQTLSTEETLDNAVFSLYPNPTRDVIYIAISSEHVGTQAQMSCFDVRGRQVLSQKDLILKPNTPVDLSSLPSGIYLLKLDTPKHQQNFKIQIE